MDAEVGGLSSRVACVRESPNAWAHDAPRASPRSTQCASDPIIWDSRLGSWRVTVVVMGALVRTAAEVRAALHAASGVPALFRAARRAGAGYRGATDVLVCSAIVLLVVAPRAAGVSGRQNAVRHFVWQALLSARHGEGVARGVADAQERGSVQLRDSAADRRNNAVGQAYGTMHARDLAGLPLRVVLHELFEVGLAKWQAGELADASARPRAGGAGRRRRGWRGRAMPRTRP